MRHRAPILAAIALALVASAAPAANSGDNFGAGANWVNHAGGAEQAGFSQLATISSANIGKLGLAWSMDLPGEVSLEATPLAVDGVLYFSGSYGAVYAVDGASGRLKWKYDPEIWKVYPNRLGNSFAVNRGVAYAGGKVFVGQIDGRLIALDAKSGKPIWTTQTLPANAGRYVITGAPIAFDGKVLIGNGGADSMMRGYVSAYDQATGQQVWRFNIVPGKPEENAGNPAMEMAAKTWSPDFWKAGGGGGNAWNGFTFDAELGRIYIGTGNAGPYNPRVRSPGGGDNLFVASVVALDAKTGQYLWHYQENTGDSLDYKSVANMVMATLPVNGTPTKVLLHQPTNGFFYVIDRNTGKLLSAEKTSPKVNWADKIDLATGRPVERPNIRYEQGESRMWPSMIGTHNWQDMAFSPKTGLVYIPYQELGAVYTMITKPGDFVFGGMTAHGQKLHDDDGHGALLAWDPVAQKPRWKVPVDTMWNGGTLATSGNLVFQGAGNGWFSAYDAVSGKRVWRFNAGLGINGAPISYAVAGRQYVSVLVGYGGTTAAMSEFLNAGWKYGAQPRRLLTFALGGAKHLPKSLPQDFTVKAVDDPALVLDEKAVAAGRSLSGMMGCIACHGIGLKGAGSPAPDLRESSLTLSEDALYAVLHDSALASRGMPGFPLVTRSQVRNLQAYIRATAREALGTRKPLGEEAGLSKF